MIRCPNKNTKAWKRMVEKLGESEAYYAYMQNDYDLLDEKELDEYIAEDEKKIEDITTNLQQEPIESLFSDEIINTKEADKVELEDWDSISNKLKPISKDLQYLNKVRATVLDLAYEENRFGKTLAGSGILDLDNAVKTTPRGYPVWDIPMYTGTSITKLDLSEEDYNSKLNNTLEEDEFNLMKNDLFRINTQQANYYKSDIKRAFPKLDNEQVDNIKDLLTDGNVDLATGLIVGLNKDTPPAFSTGLPPETPIADVALKTLLDNLSNRFDIKYNLIADDEAKTILGEHYKPNAKGFFYKDQVYMISGKADLGTAIHEFSHPFVDALFRDGNFIFKQLVEEANKALDDGWLEPMHESYTSLNENDYNKELIVHAIEQLGENKIDKKTGNVLINLLNKFLDWVKSIFYNSDIQSKLADESAEITYKDLISKLSYNAKLSDIANLILMSKAKLVNTSSLKQEYTIENIFALNESNIKPGTVNTLEKEIDNWTKKEELYHKFIENINNGEEVVLYDPINDKPNSSWSRYGIIKIDNVEYLLRHFMYYNSSDKTTNPSDRLEIEKYSAYTVKDLNLEKSTIIPTDEAIKLLAGHLNIVSSIKDDYKLKLSELKKDGSRYTTFINQLKSDGFEEAGLDVQHLESLLNSSDRDSAKLAAQIILSQIKANNLISNYEQLFDEVFKRLNDRYSGTYVISPSNQPKFSLDKQTSTNISTLEFAPLFSKLNDITDKLTKFKSNTFSSSEAPKPIDVALIPTDPIFNKLIWFAKKYNDELKVGVLDFKQREQILDALINSAKLLTKKIAKGQVDALPLDEDYKQNLVDMLLDPDQNSIAIEILNGMYSAYGVAQPNLSQAALEKDAIDEYLALDTSHKAGLQAIEIFLKDLQARTGVDYKFISQQEMVSNAGIGTLAYYNPSDNSTYFTNYVSFDTVFHEFCHPFVTTLRLTNSELFNTLYDQITNNGKNITQFYPNKETLAYYQNLGQEQEETFVRAMEQLGSGLINRSTGKPIIEAIQRFLDWLKRFLFGDTASTIIIKDLSVNTTLRELTEMMLAHKGKIEMFRGSVISRKFDDSNLYSAVNIEKALIDYNNNTQQLESWLTMYGEKITYQKLIKELKSEVRTARQNLTAKIVKPKFKDTDEELEWEERAYEIQQERNLELSLWESNLEFVQSLKANIDTFKSTYSEIVEHEQFEAFKSDPAVFAPIISSVIYNVTPPNINRQLELPDNSEEIANRKVSKVEDILERGIRLKQFVDTAASRSKLKLKTFRTDIDELERYPHVIYRAIDKDYWDMEHVIKVHKMYIKEWWDKRNQDVVLSRDEQGIPKSWTIDLDIHPEMEHLLVMHKLTDEEVQNYIKEQYELLSSSLLDYNKWKLAQQDIDSAIDTFVNYANQQDLNLSKEYLLDPSAVYVIAGIIDEEALDNTIELIDEANRNLSEEQIEEVYEEDDLPFSLFTSDNILAKDELLDLATKLSTQLQVPFALVDKPEAKWAGMFKDGKVYLNLARVTAETPFHEFCHPLVDSIKRDNPKLYQALLSELKTTSYGKKLLTEAQDLYDTGNRTQDEIEEEGVVELIARFSTGKISEQELTSVSNKSLFTKLIEFLKNIGKLLFRMSSDKAQSMKSVYEKTWHVEDFSNKWRAIDIANVLKYGTRINGEYNTLIKAGDQIVRTLSGEEGYKAEESKFWPQHTYSVEQLGGVYHYIGAYMNNAGINKVGDAIENFTKLLSKPNTRVELAATSGSSDQDYLSAVSKIRIHFKDDARIKYAFSVDIGSVLQKTKSGDLRRVTTRDEFLYDNPDNPFANKEKDVWNDSPYDEVLINASKDNIKEIELILTEDEYFNIQQTLELKQANLDVKGETEPAFYIHYRDILKKLADLTGANITYSASDGTSSEVPLYTPKPRKNTYSNRVKFSLFANPIDQQATDTSTSTSSTQVNPNTSEFNVIVIGDNLSKSEETQLAKLQSQPNILIHEQSLVDNYNSTLASIKDMLSTLDSVSNAGLIMMGESNFNKESLANDIFTNFDANYSNC